MQVLYSDSKEKKTGYSDGRVFFRLILSLCVLAMGLFYVAFLDETTDVYAEEGDVEINETNFPDPVFRKFVRSNYNTTWDDVLSADEIAAVTEMSMFYPDGMKSLKGIEYFTEMKKLTISGCEAEELDLSSDMKLEYLEMIYSNHFKRVNVSGCKNLLYFDCANNEIEKLDLSNLTKLKALSCSDNHLKGLDLSNNRNLIGLECYKNSFQFLDLRANTKLKAKKELHWYKVDSLEGFNKSLLTPYYIIVMKDSDLGWREWENNKVYILDDGSASNGLHFATGWQKIDSKYYYFNKKGYLLTGFKTIDGQKYYLGKDGARTKGFQTISKKTYYFNKDGVMQTGWQKIGGKKYYFYPEGTMAKSEWIDGKWLNKDGTQTNKSKGKWKKTEAGKRYLGIGKKLIKNRWVRIDRTDCYFDRFGYLVEGARKVGKKTVAPTEVWMEINYKTKTEILKRLNEIRKEAYKLGLIKKYTPIKWSYDLEEIAAIRAAEVTFYIGHDRPNGESWSDLKSSSGKQSSCEIIASNKDPVSAINNWYQEKDDYIRAKKGKDTSGDIGHYAVMINCSYIGIASLGASAGEGSNDTSLKNNKRYIKKGVNTVSIELQSSNANLTVQLKNDLKSKKKNISSVDVCAGQTVEVCAILKNGYKYAEPMNGGGSWYSLKKSVATVTKDGKIKGVKKGTATLIYRNGVFCKKLTVKVHAPANKLKWKSDGTGRRLVESTGWYPTNEQIVLNGKKYYFNKDGYMASNEWYFGQYYKPDGTAGKQSDGHWINTKKGSRFVTAPGKYLTNIYIFINGTKYGFDSRGYMSEIFLEPE